VRQQAIEGFSDGELAALKSLLRRVQQNLKNQSGERADCREAAESRV
jgi:hypothetical protein